MDDVGVGARGLDFDSIVLPYGLASDAVGPVTKCHVGMELSPFASEYCAMSLGAVWNGFTFTARKATLVDTAPRSRLASTSSRRRWKDAVSAGP